MIAKVRCLLLALAILLAGFTAAPSASALGCPAILVIPSAMRIQTRYLSAALDPTRSRLDSAMVASQQVVRADIAVPVRRINLLADRYRTTPSKENARCLMSHLNAQARGRAMLDSVTDADMFYREWMVGSLAISYFKAKSALDRRADSVGFLAWLRLSAESVQTFNQKRMDRGIIDNHRFWGGLAVLASGLALGDQPMIEFGRRVRRIGLLQVRADGTMPSELTRGAKSLHYHLFAAAPLITSAVINGRPVTDAERSALTRLAGRIVEDTHNPDSIIAQRTGVTQSNVEHPVLYALLRPYLSGQPARLAKLDGLIANTPPTYLFLGGDTRYFIR